MGLRGDHRKGDDRQEHVDNHNLLEVFVRDFEPGGGAPDPGAAAKLTVGAESVPFGSFVAWQVAVDVKGTGVAWSVLDPAVVVCVEAGVYAVQAFGTTADGIAAAGYRSLQVEAGAADAVGAWHGPPVFPTNTAAHPLSGSWTAFVEAGGQIRLTPLSSGSEGGLDIVFMRVQRVA